MMRETPQKPEKEFRAGGIKAAIWRTETIQDERTVVQHTVRVQKRYRDQQTGEWKDTEYLFPNDLPKLELVVHRAYEYIALRESEEMPGQ